jgi:hypothetical protein
MTNQALYKKCNMTELEPIIRNAKFDHTLRMNDKIPSKGATLHYFEHIGNGFKGRLRRTLPLVISKYLKRAANPEQH